MISPVMDMLSKTAAGPVRPVKEHRAGNSGIAIRAMARSKRRTSGKDVARVSHPKRTIFDARLRMFLG